MTAHRITAEEIAKIAFSRFKVEHEYPGGPVFRVWIYSEDIRAELDRLHADGMPKDREELQKLQNDAHRKGDQEAHEAHRLVREIGLGAQGGEVPEGISENDEELLRCVERALDNSPSMFDGYLFDGMSANDAAIALDAAIRASRANSRPTPHRPDTVEVSREEWMLLQTCESVLRGSWPVHFSGRPLDDLDALRAQAQPATNETRG